MHVIPCMHVIPVAFFVPWFHDGGRDASDVCCGLRRQDAIHAFLIIPVTTLITFLGWAYNLHHSGQVFYSYKSSQAYEAVSRPPLVRENMQNLSEPLGI